MKLYATVTSERASKGQGGNDKLEIELYAKDSKGKNVVIGCVLGYVKDNHTAYAIYNVADIASLQLTGKNRALISYYPDKQDCGCKKGEYACAEHYKQTKADRLIHDQDNIREQERQEDGEWLGQPHKKGKKQKGETCPYCTQYPCSRHDGSKYE